MLPGRPGMLAAMVHYSRLSQIVVDAPAETHDAEVAFWRGALGIPLARNERFPAFHGAPLSTPGLGFLVQHLGTGPARVHVDIHTDDLAAEVARLEKLGATVIDDAQGWTILRDPAGLLICVVPDPRIDATNATGWPA
jgi:Glyoxalase-like domain